MVAAVLTCDTVGPCLSLRAYLVHPRHTGHGLHQAALVLWQGGILAHRFQVAEMLRICSGGKDVPLGIMDCPLHLTSRPASATYSVMPRKVVPAMPCYLFAHVSRSPRRKACAVI